MIAAAAFAFALFATPPKTVVVRRYRAGAWRVLERTDRFTGGVRCEIGRPRIRLQGRAVLFDVGRTGEVVDVRLDDGPALRVDADTGLDPLRISPDVALNNPSGGEVGLPIARITGTNHVWIRGEGEDAPRRFDVSGLDAALRIAANAGCPQSRPAL